MVGDSAPLSPVPFVGWETRVTLAVAPAHRVEVRVISPYQLRRPCCELGEKYVAMRPCVSKEYARGQDSWFWWEKGARRKVNVEAEAEACFVFKTRG